MKFCYRLQIEFANRKQIHLGIEEHNARTMSITMLAKRVNFAKSTGRETKIKVL